MSSKVLDSIPLSKCIQKENPKLGFYDVFNGSGSERRKVPADKHFVLKTPSNWAAQVCSLRTQGARRLARGH
ncbi:unnamed protein product [Caenorhabditis brenneri]